MSQSTPKRPCGNEHCSCTYSAITGHTTFGSGVLSTNGYWQFPCRICAKASGDKNAWPCDGRYTQTDDLKILKDWIMDDMNYHGDLKELPKDTLLEIVEPSLFQSLCNRLGHVFDLIHGSAIVLLWDEPGRQTVIMKHRSVDEVSTVSGVAGICKGWIHNKQVIIRLAMQLELPVNRILSVKKILKGKSKGYKIVTSRRPQ